MSDVPRVACGDTGKVVPWLLVGNGRGCDLPPVSEAWCILGGPFTGVSRGSVWTSDSQAVGVGAGLAGPPETGLP